MIKSLLVGLDGTAFSHAALELAIGWARRCGARILGLAVVDEPTIMAAAAVPLAVSLAGTEIERSQLEHARHEAAGFEERFAARCREAGVEFEVLEQHALPWESILAEAQRCDLVLLGRSTHFQFETRGGPDSTLRRCLREAPRPMVVVPETPAPGSAVVIGCDGSAYAARAVLAFATSGVLPGAPVHVLAIATAPDAELTRNAERTADFLRRHGFAAKPQFIESYEPPGDLLLAKAADVGAGLLVLGLHGRSAFGDLLAGSVIRSVLRESLVPLFLYR